MSHEFWDKVYDSETYIYGTEVNDYIKEKFKVFPKNAELLEIACGEGRNACYLADYGMKVTAIDISGKGISKLNKLAEEKNLLITGIEADFLTYPFEKKFDVILCTFFHLPKEERTFFYNKVKSILKTGGFFLAEWFHPDQRKKGYNSGGPPDPALMLTVEELNRTFLDYEILHLEKKERELQEGTHHRGKASVVQFLSRKV